MGESSPNLVTLAQKAIKFYLQLDTTNISKRLPKQGDQIGRISSNRAIGHF
jgi:hypothetical protein